MYDRRVVIGPASEVEADSVANMPDNTQAKPSIRPVGLLRGTTTVEQARDAYDAVDKLLLGRRAGPESGSRPAHTTAIYVKGVFRPLPAGADVCRSSIFKDDVDVVARISNLSGALRKRDLHGFALKFIPGGEEATTDLVALNIDRFMVTRSYDFVRFLRLADEGWRKAPRATIRFLALTLAGRASIRGLEAAAAAWWRRPRSLAALTYHGIHTFFVEDENGARLPFRYSIDAAAPAGKVRPPRTVAALYGDLIARLESDSPLVFPLMFYLPWKSDLYGDWGAVPDEAKARLIKPTVRWTTGRRLHVGTLRLSEILDKAAFTDGEDVNPSLDHLVFDPTNLADGIFPSDDEILRVRGAVYAESHMRRTT